MNFQSTHPSDLEGKVLGTSGTFACRVVRVIGVLPGSSFFWIWGQNTDPLNDDLYRWYPYYPEQEVPYVQ